MKPQQDISKFARNVAEADRLDWYSIKSLVELLEVADDMYHNHDGESCIDDKTYDSIRRHVELTDPSHVYITGVGSDVRGGKIKLPYQMGSLDQVYEGEICDWIGTWGLQKYWIDASDKLDGTSAMVIYDPAGNFQIAYSRGNGTEGADISRHIKQFDNVPQTTDQTLTVRGEVILTKEGFQKLSSILHNRGKRKYKNARNMVAGLMNSSKNDPIVYQYLKFVAYQIVGSVDDKHTNRLTLQNNGFDVVHSERLKGDTLTDGTLTAHLNTRRDRTQFEIDGLVLEVESATMREKMNPSRDTLNPAFAVKYKVADADNYAETEVVEVEWNLSKHGYLKPRVVMKPVELVGVTITHATGYNAKYIKDNQIGPGSVVAISRMGDVVPNIIKTIKSTKASMPVGNYTWTVNDSGVEVDAVLVDHHGHDDVIVNQLIDFFSSIDAPYLKKGNVQKMYDSGIDTVEAFILAPQDDYTDVLGENGKKAWEGLFNKLQGIPLYKLMGALPYFGRGVGVRKFKKLQKAIGAEPLLTIRNVDDIIRVDGFEYKTAKKIISGMAYFDDFMEKVEEWITVDYGDDEAVGGSLNDEKVVFTGFRDKPLQELVEAQGGTIQSGISGKTTILVAKNPTSTSGKMKKARDLNVRIMGIDEFKEMIGA